MKSLSNLPAFLRTMFGFAYRFCIIMGVLFVVGQVVPLFLPNLATDARFSDNLTAFRRIGYGNLSINLAHPVTVKTPNSGSTSVGFLELRGSILLLVDNKDPALVSAIYATLVPVGIVGTLFYILLFRLLRDLCGRIERGEVFSEKNLRSVRNVGLLLIISSVVSSALAFWCSLWLGSYLNRNATVTGIDATIDFSMLNLDFKWLVTGLLVLLIAEAFRQGLLLKKENELTV